MFLHDGFSSVSLKISHNELNDDKRYTWKSTWWWYELFFPQDLTMFSWAAIFFSYAWCFIHLFYIQYNFKFTYVPCRRRCILNNADLGTLIEQRARFYSLSYWWDPFSFGAWHLFHLFSCAYRFGLSPDERIIRIMLETS